MKGRSATTNIQGVIEVLEQAQINPYSQSGVITLDVEKASGCVMPWITEVKQGKFYHSFDS